MRAPHEATVDRAAFVAAIKQRGRVRRGPVRIRGARSKVPLDTLIYADGPALVIDTPTLVVRLPMVGAWAVCVSVPAAALATIAPKLKPNPSVTLLFAVEVLAIDDGAFILRAREATAPAKATRSAPPAVPDASAD